MLNRAESNTKPLREKQGSLEVCGCFIPRQNNHSVSNGGVVGTLLTSKLPFLITATSPAL